MMAQLKKCRYFSILNNVNMYSEETTAIYVIVYFVLCCACAFMGSNRRIGSTGAFFTALFFTPFTGVILVHLSERNIDYKIKRLKDLEDIKRLMPEDDPEQWGTQKEKFIKLIEREIKETTVTL